MSAARTGTATTAAQQPDGPLHRLGGRAFPAHGDDEGARHRVLRGQELQRLVRVRGAGPGGADPPAGHRHLPDDELQALRRGRLRVRRIHHAGGGVGLADPLHALHRRLDVLRGGLPAHVPRPDVRLLQGPARTAVDRRHADLPGADGGGLHGLPAALGPDVLLGRPGDRLAVRRDPGRRRGPRGVDPRRLLHLRHHAEPLLRAARRGGAAGAAAARGRAHPGPAHDRLAESRTASRSRRRRAPTAFRWTASPSTRTTRPRTWWRSSSSPSCSPRCCSSRRRWAGTSWSTPTSSRPTC